MNRFFGVKTFVLVSFLVILLSALFTFAAIPVVDFVTLNTTNVQVNDTSQNLTLYINVTDSDGDATVNITKWFVNSKSLALLHLPFENNTLDISISSRDYSTYENNATISGATWNFTNGYGGYGAYYFDGVDDYATIQNSGDLNLTTSFTIHTWIKPFSIPRGNARIITKSGVNNSGINYSLGDADVTFFGATDFDGAGEDVATGDLNADGIDDIIIGAPAADLYDGGDRKGITYVFYGPINNSAVINLSLANVTFFGKDYFDQAGSGVASGDLNNDGFDDLIIGAWLAERVSDSPSAAGETYVLYGPFNNSANINVSQANVTFYGTGASDQSGFTVTSGDFNNDQIDDIAIGAYQAEGIGGTTNDEGETYVLYGPFNGSALINVSLANITFFGIDADDNSGEAVDSGDFNDDGIDDLMIGAPDAEGAGGTFSGEGETYIMFGPFNNSGVISLSNSNVTFYGVTTFDSAGADLGGGDVNGDGIDDALIGAWAGSIIATNGEGETYVMYGPFTHSSVIDLQTANITFYGIDTSDNSASGITVGDFNNDGLNDIMIGADQAEGAGGSPSSAGEIYVIYGAFQTFENYNLMIDDNASIVFSINGSTGLKSGSINSEVYTAIAVTVDSTTRNMSLYINGKLNNSYTYSGDINPNHNDLIIGSLDGTRSLFNGTIDDLQIFNRSLSPEQIAALFLNQTKTIVSQELNALENWQGCVISNDGNNDADEVCSNTLTIKQSSLLEECRNLDEPGTVYDVINDLTADATCFNITGSDIVLDCHGHTVEFANATNGSGVYITNESQTLFNVTVKNCIFRRGDITIGESVGINLDTVNSSIIFNNTVDVNGSAHENFGIRIRESSSNNFSMNHIKTNGTNDNYGVYLERAEINNTFFNNTISASGNANDNYGVYMWTSSSIPRAQQNLFIDNIITSYGTTVVTPNYGIYVGSTAYNNTFKNNIVLSGGSSTGNTGIFVLDSHNIIIGNKIWTNGTGGDHGIHINAAADQNNSVINNTITLSDVSSNGIRVGGDGTKVISNVITLPGDGSNFGIYVGSDYNIIHNNSITHVTRGGASNYGVQIDSSADSNNITNNTIHTRGTSQNYGIYARGDYNRFENNYVVTNGSSTLNYPFYGSSLYLSIIKNNVLIGKTSDSHGIYLVASDHNIFVHNYVNITTIDSDDWREWGTSGGIRPFNNTVYNLTIARNNASISFQSYNATAIRALTLQETIDLGVPSGYLSLAKFFNITVNSSVSWLNINVSYFDEEVSRAQIANETELGVWKYNESTWINTSFYTDVYGVNNETNIVFANLTTFSTFGVFGKDVPTPCAILSGPQTYVVTENVSSSGTCFTINSSNVYLDCSGFEITYATTTSGYGINISGNGTVNNGTLTNITISHCVIKNGLDSGDNHGIYMYNVSNSTIVNTTIITNISGAVGLYLESESANNNFTGLDISTVGENAYGIYFKNESEYYPYNNTFTTLTLNVTNTSDVVFELLNSTITNFFVNATYNYTNISYIGDPSSNLDLSWLVRVFVSSFNQTSVEFANVTLKTIANATEWSVLTNNSGYAGWIPTTQYIENNSGRTYFANQTINTSRDGFGTFVISRNITNSTEFSVIIPASTILESCSLIQSPGFYTVSQNVSNGGNCFNITTSNVTLDCLGNRIVYGLTQSAKGIVVYNENTGLTNVTVKNCEIVKGDSDGSENHGIFFMNTNSSFIINNTINTTGSANENIGVYFDTVSNSTLINNSIFTNGTTNSDGIEFDSSCNNLIHKNNIFFLQGVGIQLGVGTCNVNISENEIQSFNGSTAIIFQSVNNTIEHNNITMIGNFYASRGIWVVGQNSTVRENSIYINALSATFGGINIQGPARNNLIINNTVRVYGPSSMTGIDVNGPYNSIKNNLIIVNASSALGFNIWSWITDGGYNNTIASNLIIINSTTRSVGFDFNDDDNKIVNNTIQIFGGDSMAVLIDGGDSNHFIENEIVLFSNMSKAIYLFDGDDNLFYQTIINVTNETSHEWQSLGSSFSPSINNTLINVTYTRNNLTLSFFDFNGTIVRSIPNNNLPSSPSKYSSVGKYLNITANSTYSWIFINITYNEQNITSDGFVENTLRIWRHNGTNWTNTNFYTDGLYGVNVIDNYVFANISNFSTFGLFGPIDGYPPNVSILYPLANATFNISNQIELAANVSEGDILASVLMNITYPNGSTTQVALSNSTTEPTKFNISYTIPRKVGNYTVTYTADDVSGNVNSTEHRNFTVQDVVNPSVILLIPSNNSIFNVTNLVEIGINTTDDVGVLTVLAEVTFPNASKFNVTLTNETSHPQKFNTSFVIPQLVGVYNITFFVNDSSNNINNSESTNFTAQDRIAPSITFARINDTSPLANLSTVRVNATIVDFEGNLDTVLFEVTPPLSNSYNSTPTQSGDEFYDDVTLDELGIWTFRFYANDTEGNVNASLADDDIGNAFMEIAILNCEGTEPPKTGNWVINDITTCHHSNFTIVGNISVEEGATLILNNVTLIIDASESDNHFGFDGSGNSVFSSIYYFNNSGNLYINWSNISVTNMSADSADNYLFSTYGPGYLELTNSFIYHAGDGSDYYGDIPHDDKGIALLYANNSIIRNNTIQQSPFVNGFNTLGAIYLYYAHNTTIVDNSIVNGGDFVIQLYESDNNNVTNNTGPGSIEILNSELNNITSNKITNDQLILSNANFNTVLSNIITNGYISSSSSHNVSYISNTIVNGSYGFFFTFNTYHSNISFNNITVNNSNSVGIYFLSGGYYNQIMYNNIVSLGNRSHGVIMGSSLSDVRNEFYRLNITVYGENSSGISLFGYTFNTNFTQANVLTFGLNSPALSIRNSSPLSGGLFPRIPYNNYFYDSTFTSINTSVIQIKSQNTTFFVNSTFNQSNVTFDEGHIGGIDVAWYVDIFVNGTNFDGIDEANVTSKTTNGSLEWSAITNGSGSLSRIETTEFIMNRSGKYYYTNYTINVTHEDYVSKEISVNFSTNAQFNITLTPILSAHFTYPFDNQALGGNDGPFNVSGKAGDQNGVSHVNVTVSDGFVGNATLTPASPEDFTIWNATWGPGQSASYVLTVNATNLTDSSATENLTIHYFNDSSLNNVTCISCGVTNSTIAGTVLTGSNVTGSTVGASYLTNSDVSGSTVNGSTLVNATVTNSAFTVINSTINESTIITSTIVQSDVNKSTIENSTVDESIIFNSTINASLVNSSYFNGSIITNRSYITNSTLDFLIGSNLSIAHERCDAGNITFNGLVYACPKNLSDIYRECGDLANTCNYAIEGCGSCPEDCGACSDPVGGGGGGGGGGGAEEVINEEAPENKQAPAPQSSGGFSNPNIEEIRQNVFINYNTGSTQSVGFQEEKEIIIEFTNKLDKPVFNISADLIAAAENYLPVYTSKIIDSGYGALKVTRKEVDKELITAALLEKIIINKIDPGETITEKIRVRLPLTARDEIDVTVVYTTFGVEIKRQNVTFEVIPKIAATALHNNEDNTFDLYAIISDPLGSEVEELSDAHLIEDIPFVNQNELTLEMNFKRSASPIYTPTLAIQGLFAAMFAGEATRQGELFGPYPLNPGERILLAQQFEYDDFFIGDYNVTFTLRRGNELISKQEHVLDLRPDSNLRIPQSPIDQLKNILLVFAKYSYQYKFVLLVLIVFMVGVYGYFPARLYTYLRKHKSQDSDIEFSTFLIDEHIRQKYVINASDFGLSKEQITKLLIEKGWDDHIAIAYVHSLFSKKSKKRVKKRKSQKPLW